MNTNVVSLKSAALYCRLSRDDGLLGDSSSIQSQRKLLIDYAEQNNWNIFDIYTDDGYSGTNFNRPDFQRMCKDIEAGRIDIVVTKDLSRLGRNYIKTGEYTDEYFPNHNVRFIAISDNIDTQKQDDASMDFAPFKNVINEWYAKDASKKIRTVFKLRKSRGEVIKTAVPLYGYSYSDDGKIVIDQEEANVVKYLFYEFANNTSTKVIREYLFNDKVYTPGYSQYLKTGFNKNRYEQFDEIKKYTWTEANICRIIGTIDYTGLYIANKGQTRSFKNKKRVKISKEEAFVFEDIRPAIVTKELYDKANERKKSRFRPRIISSSKPLYGLLYCENCGKRLNYYYQPQQVNAKEFFACRKKCGKEGYIRYEVINEIVRKYLKQLKTIILSNKESLINYASTYVPKLTESSDLPKQNQNKEELLKKKSVLENKIRILFEEHFEEKIPTEIYDKMNQQFRKELMDLEKELKKFQEVKKENKTNKIDYVQATKEYIHLLEEYDENLPFDNEQLSLLISRILIGKIFPKGSTNKHNYETTIKIELSINGELIENYLLDK